jgi:predicted dehydrogenase
MRILVVGAGMYVTGRSGTGAGTVLASIAQFSRAHPIEQITVAARNPQNAGHVAEAAARINSVLGTKISVGYERLSESNGLEQVLKNGRFDCAIVSVPDHLHYPIARIVIEQGVSPLVVKPLTPTLAEAKALTALARGKGCYGAVEFHKRFDDANLYAKKVLDEGTLGVPLYATVDYSQRISIPTVVFREWANRTNIFQYLAVHYVDLISYITAFVPTRAMAIGVHGTLRERGIDTYDSVLATVIWREPSTGRELVSQFATNWIDPERSSSMSYQKYKIVGTAGRIELNQKDRGVELTTTDHGIQAINLYFSEFLPDPAGGVSYSGYGYRSIERFLLDISDLAARRVQVGDLERLRPSFASALPATAVIEAVNSSLRRNSEWETIGEIV